MPNAAFQPTEGYFFAPFCLDPASGRLWRGNVPLPLRPKAFALLHYLVERPQLLLSKEALLDALWPNVAVSESVLKTHVKDVRQALGDVAKTPLFIETVHRRGYRFIADVSARAASPRVPMESLPASDAAVFVGRKAELRRLTDEFERALAGTLRLVFVAGEPGIGKTTLVQRALVSFQTSSAWITWGQCISTYGPGEAYLPILEGLGRICRGPGGDVVVDLLRRHAPSWLAKLPEFLDAATLVYLERILFGSGPERMLREFAITLPLLTSMRPLVLVLEDLQWADPSTFVLLSYLARGTQRSALLIVGTYRPQELESCEHPLRTTQQDLRGRGCAEEIAVERLTSAEVADYLDGRFDGHAFPPELAHHMHARTGGSPLFLVRLIDALVESGALNGDVKPWRLNVGLESIARQVPSSLSAMIEGQLQRLTEFERSVLEAASVVGFEFGSNAVAHAIESDVDVTERLCRDWARRGQFIRSRGFADGLYLHFEFDHALYQQVVYERRRPRRSVCLHRRIAEYEAAQHQGDTGSIAPSLALHFEQAHLYSSAIHYRHMAGEYAARRGAFAEAIGHFSAGTRVLEKLPDDAERQRRELDLSVGLTVPLVMTLGYAAPRVQEVYARVSELCRELGETAQSVHALVGIATFHLARAEYSDVVELGERLVTLAQPSAMASAQVQFVIGMAQNCQGHFVEASQHFNQAIAFADASTEPYSQIALYPQDPGIACRSLLGLMQWYTGRSDSAVRTAEDALERARALEQPSGIAFALNCCCFIRNYRREPELALAHARELIALSVEQGFAYWTAFGTMNRGIALVMQGDYRTAIETLTRGCEAYHVTGAALGVTYARTELARALTALGNHSEAWRVLDDVSAQMARTGERFFEPEICRLRAELCDSGAGFVSRHERRHEPPLDEDDPVGAWLEEALQAAQRSEGRSFELRAAIHLGRHWSDQGRAQEARKLVLAALARMPADVDQASVREAQGWLAEL